MKREAWVDLAYCVGKKSFDTFGAAEAVADRKGRKRGRRAYHCPVCHKYHVGQKSDHRPKRKRPIFIDDIQEA